MPSTPAQLWKSTPFDVQSRFEESGMITFRFTGPFTARDMYSCLSPADLQGILEAAPEQAVVHCFDMTAVPYIDSRGIRILMSHSARCQAQGIHLLAFGLNDRLREAFKLARVEHLLQTIPDVEEYAPSAA